MNITNAHHNVTTLASATAVAAALTVLSVVGPAVAGARPPDPYPGPGAHVGGGAGSPGAVTFDIDMLVADRKARMAQFYVDHAGELDAR